MVEDNGKRLRWRDKYSAPSVERKAAYLLAGDVDRLAWEEVRTGMANPNLGQRAGETAGAMRGKVRDCIAAIEVQFNPENPQLASFKTQFEKAKPEAKQGYTWEQVVGAMKRGGRFNLADRLLAKTRSLENPSIYFIQGNELVIGDGGDEVPERTLGMGYFHAQSHCKWWGLDMLEVSEWNRLQEVRPSKVEQRFITWCKTEQVAIDAGFQWRASLRGWGGVHAVYRNPEYDGAWCRGVRRVLRVNLAFES